MGKKTDVVGLQPRSHELNTRYGRLAVPDVESDLIGQFLSRYGEWAWFEAVFVASVIPEGARVLDVGAFVGTFGLGVARSRSLSFLCCVEPNPIILPMLKNNVLGETSFPTVVLEAIVAGPGVRAGISHNVLGNFGATSFSMDDEVDAPGAVEALTLADLRTAHGTFDLVKLDIEGMELDALHGDAEFLADGQTTLWIEANEDPRTLEVANLLILWNLDLYYFAFPSFNPLNFNGNLDPIFPFAFEAGLLAAPKTPPCLTPEMKLAGCILLPLRSIDELKKALWRTPRWGLTEWQEASGIQELAALAGRSIRGESFTEFLLPNNILPPDSRMVIWHLLHLKQTELKKKGEELNYIKQTVLDMQILIESKQNKLRDANAKLALYQQSNLRGQELLQDRQHALDDAVNRLASAEMKIQDFKWQSEELQSQRKKIEKELQGVLASEVKNLRELSELRRDLLLIQNSTIWRISGPLRGAIDRLPILRVAVLKTRQKWQQVRNRLLGKGDRAIASSADAQPRTATLTATDLTHRNAVRPYFDDAYYLASNPDVSALGIDPLDHFFAEGWREGRNPNPSFNVSWYLDTNQDVAVAGINPLLHYAWAGRLEDRPTQRVMDVERTYLAAARSPRIRAADWGDAVNQSVALPSTVLRAALSDQKDCLGIIVSFSHDDYATNWGGVQNVIADEQRAFRSSGWQYLHVSPAAPLPILADVADGSEYRLWLRLNGQAIGVFSFSNLVSALAEFRGLGTKLAFVVHHFLGHIPELIATLRTDANETMVVWAHDFFTLCPAFKLMRNDIRFCAAPPIDSGACNVCVFGTERRAHLIRMRNFFAAINPILLAPSMATFDFWRHLGGYAHVSGAVVPPARLAMERVEQTSTISKDVVLRVAHLGSASMHKGWNVFERLVFEYSDDPRYQFYHLGLDGVPSSAFVRDPVMVSPDRRDAMIHAVMRHQIDVVVCWSLWPETFCFTVHEALAGGAFVIAREDAGNIWPAVRVNAPGQGIAVNSEVDLFQLFKTGKIQELVISSQRFRGALHPGGNTAEFLLGNQSEAASFADEGEVHL